jgi:hypothetical protein
MLMSEAIDQIAPAFVKAQAACAGAKKASNNPHFKSKYADLTQVWSACEDALEANGLAVLQGLGEAREGAMHMDTMLLHVSGQWFKAHASIPLPKGDPQGYGSATTYLRRYALAAIMGIVQEDDDGNAASRPTNMASQTREPTIDAQQCAQLRQMIAQADTSEETFLSAGLKFKGTLPELPARQYDAAIRVLSDRIARLRSDRKEAA